MINNQFGFFFYQAYISACRPLWQTICGNPQCVCAHFLFGQKKQLWNEGWFRLCFLFGLGCCFAQGGGPGESGPAEMAAVKKSVTPIIKTDFYVTKKVLVRGSFVGIGKSPPTPHINFSSSPMPPSGLRSSLAWPRISLYLFPPFFCFSRKMGKFVLVHLLHKGGKGENMTRSNVLSTRYSRHVFFPPPFPLPLVSLAFPNNMVRREVGYYKPKERKKRQRGWFSFF